jgi:hypothetical protein
MTNSDSLLTALTSLCALVISQISINIADDSFLKLITAISSIVLCFTAIIKLIDLCTDKIPKWTSAVQARFKAKKPPTL